MFKDKNKLWVSLLLCGLVSLLVCGFFSKLNFNSFRKFAEFVIWKFSKTE